MRKRRTSRRWIHNANRPIDTTLVLAELRLWSSTLPETPKNRYLRDHLFSKLNDPSVCSPEERRNSAIEKWEQTECRNQQTNRRLTGVIDPDKAHCVDFIRKLIERVIGAVPPDTILEKGSFSGGATTSRSRTSSHPAMKYVGRADITADALPLWESIDNPVWELVSPIDINVVPGNVMFTVPKTSHIDRVACKEPDLNMYMQKAHGDFIRRRLLKHGINLRDQSRNRRLALQGSIDGSLATIDLSSASDSVTTGLCELLLPTLWYSRLMSLRSPTTNINGRIHVNEMMSSMGNGFTFELESLLFYGITRCAAWLTKSKGTISIYGDDIICPVKCVNTLIDLLSYFGFTVNTEKSFWTGGFRESCGGHYYNGQDITPFYLKNIPTVLTDLIHILNQIRLWSSRDSHHILDYYGMYIWNSLSRLVPKVLWCGNDYSDIYSLVSPGRPRKRLVPSKRTISTLPGGTEEQLENGRYLFALDGPMSVDIERELSIFRYKRHQESWDSVTSLFLTEL